MAWYGIITDAGRELIAEYVAAHISIDINALTVGSGLVSEENMRYSTNLVSYRDNGKIIDYKAIAQGIDFKFQIGPCTNGAYIAKEMGLWANSSDNTQGTMIALFQNNDGVQIPAEATNPDYVYMLSAVLAIDNLDNLTITIDSTAYVPYSVYTPYTESVAIALNGKVDKVTGYGLSQQNYTPAEKLKLAGIENEANKDTLPPATAGVLGGVKIGVGIGVASDGAIRNSGVRSVATGSANGTISVNTDGTANNVAVKGLASAAYKTAETFATASHNHNASNITAGTLPVARGGTGITQNPSELVNLASETAASVFAASPRPGVTGVLPLAHGGTGANNAASARSNIGAAAASHNHDAGNITSGTLPIGRGGTGMTTNPSMVTNLGSTSAASVFASNPKPGVTGTLPIANGGTSMTSNPSMLTNLGSTTAASVFTASPRPGVTGTLPIGNGGTGMTSNPSLLTNLGSGSAASVFAASPRPGVTGVLSVGNGGTGANNAASARSNLGAADVNHTHTPASIGAAAAGHTHNLDDLSGGFKVGFFDGDDSTKRTITVGFYPSRVVLIALPHGKDTYTRGTGTDFTTGTPLIQLLTFKRGQNYIVNYGGSQDAWITTQNASEINTYFSKNWGGCAIIPNGTGFYVGKLSSPPVVDTYGDRYNTWQINHSKYTYMWMAWR